MQKYCQSLFVAVFIVFTFFGAMAWAAPSIYFPEKEWDWGEVYSGERIVHVFSFENKGDETLKIENIDTSCGCTAALTTDKDVPPGGTGKIEVTFDTRGFRGRSHKVVYVSSNDPAMRRAELRIYGNLRVDLLIRPRNIYMGFRDRKEIRSSNIVLINQGKNPIKVLDVNSGKPEVGVDFKGPQTISPGEKPQVPVKLKMPEKGNRFVGQLVMHTDHPRHQKIKIPVRLQAMPPVPERTMKNIPFLERLRQYKEQQERRKREQKEETSQSPATSK
ncbi:MAG: DUF1573 domain-containing protein [Deltaproteobacteria bacterium]|nr:DUF1573 domain-containing protein [Deltaproteobacteria bacterium]